MADASVKHDTVLCPNDRPSTVSGHASINQCGAAESDDDPSAFQ